MSDESEVYSQSDEDDYYSIVTKDRSVQTDLYQSIDTLKKMREFLKEGLLTDLTLSNNEKEFRVHSLLVASHSDYISGYLIYNNDQRTIKLNDISTEVLCFIIDFIYDSSKIIPSELLFDIFEAGNFLLMTSLVKECIKSLVNITKWDLKLAKRALQLSQKYSTPEIQKRLDSFICSDFGANCRLLEAYDQESLAKFISEFEVFKTGEDILLGTEYKQSIRQCILDQLKNSEKAEPIAQAFANEFEERALNGSSLFYGEPNALARSSIEIGYHPSYYYDYEKKERKITIKPPSPSDWYVKKLTIFRISGWDGHAKMISGVKIIYQNRFNNSTHEETTPQIDYSDSVEFILEEGEFIKSISVMSGWMIDNMIFLTNKGRRLEAPDQSAGGGRREISIDDKMSLFESSVRDEEHNYQGLQLVGFQFDIITTHNYISWSQVRSLFNTIEIKSEQI